MKRSLVFATDALDPLVRLSREAEAAGFDRVWTTEYLGRDAFVRALAIAQGTERIGVGTGIAYAFTRPPLAMAALSADAQRLSHGRFAVGVGSGTRGVRRWYGVEHGFEKPGPDMAAYADGVRKGWGKDPQMPDAPPELHAAALNPIMARHVAGAYDGVLLHPIALVRKHLRERVLPAIAKGAGGRDIGIAAWVITSIHADETVAIDAARRQLAFYLTTPSYATVVEGTPFEGVATAVRDAFDGSDRKASWADLAEHVPVELATDLCLCGTPDQVRARAAEVAAELSEDGITELAFQTVLDVTEAELVHNCEQIIEHLGTIARQDAERPSLSAGLDGPRR